LRRAVFAGADSVAALVFEVVEEGPDQWRVNVADIQRGWFLAGSLGGEGQQQPERVTVAGDGVVAGIALANEPVGEERLQQEVAVRRDLGWRRPRH